jgi:hypothetical protein
MARLDQARVRCSTAAPAVIDGCIHSSTGTNSVGTASDVLPPITCPIGLL